MKSIAAGETMIVVLIVCVILNQRKVKKLLNEKGGVMGKTELASSDILSDSGALIVGDHFVYKSGKHGHAYINKEEFSQIGAGNLSDLLRKMASNAFSEGLDLGDMRTIGVIGPAMGAISNALAIAEKLEECFPKIKFFPARTEVEADESGKKIHTVPEKLIPTYSRAEAFIVAEDIINNGTTIEEVKVLYESVFDVQVVAAMCIADRGGQTAESLRVLQYFPYIRVQMDQFSPSECLDCMEGIPINIKLGKGDRWVKLFEQPPYPKNADFSEFWK
ncbi:hypothetical protein ACFLY1_00690 [Patescibacteria group bacterium]